ncbi:MAG: hypothetical protein OXK17_04065 [Thaumarchaeota archaeon]|nr:hypothetical protein [Nitrososphaerota archaeon]
MRSRQTMTIAALAAAVAFMLAAAPAVANTDILADIEKAITDLQKTDKKLKKDVRQLAKQVEALQQENEKQQKQIKRLKDFRGDARENISDMRDYDDAVAHLSTLSHLPADRTHQVARVLAQMYGYSEGYNDFRDWHIAMSQNNYLEHVKKTDQMPGDSFIIAHQAELGEDLETCEARVQYVPVEAGSLADSPLSCDPGGDFELWAMEGTDAFVMLAHDAEQPIQLFGLFDSIWVEMEPYFGEIGGDYMMYNVPPGFYTWHVGQYNGTLTINTYPAYGFDEFYP